MSHLRTLHNLEKELEIRPPRQPS